MTTNEKIAKWLGWTEHSRIGDSPYESHRWRNERGEPEILPHSYDDSVAYWHDEDGPLAKIGREKPYVEAFLTALTAQIGMFYATVDESWCVGPTAAFAILAATPAQLAAALVVVIDEKEESC